MASRSDSESATYSASQEESAMMVCNLEHHAIGHPAYMMTYCNQIVTWRYSGHQMQSFCANFRQNLHRQQRRQINDLSVCGRKVMPL